MNHYPRLRACTDAMPAAACTQSCHRPAASYDRIDSLVNNAGAIFATGCVPGTTRKKGKRWMRPCSGPARRLPDGTQLIGHTASVNAGI
jgi:hypothetical protein